MRLLRKFKAWQSCTGKFTSTTFLCCGDGRRLGFFASEHMGVSEKHLLVPRRPNAHLCLDVHDNLPVGALLWSIDPRLCKQGNEISGKPY